MGCPPWTTVPRSTPFAIASTCPPRARSPHPSFCAHAPLPHGVGPVANQQHSGNSIHAHMHVSRSMDTHLQFMLGLDSFFFLWFVPLALLFFLGQPQILRLLTEPTVCPHLLNVPPELLGIGVWFMPISHKDGTPTDLKGSELHKIPNTVEECFHTVTSSNSVRCNSRLRAMNFSRSCGAVSWSMVCTCTGMSGLPVFAVGGVMVMCRPGLRVAGPG